MPTIWHAQMHKGGGSAWVAVTPNNASHSTQHVSVSQYTTRHDSYIWQSKPKKAYWVQSFRG